MELYLINSILLYFTVFILCFGIAKILADEKCRIGKSVRKMLGKIKQEWLKSSIIILLVILPAVLLLTFRYGCGTDYFNYRVMYSDFSRVRYINDEIGLIALFALSNLLGLGYRGFLMFAALISLFTAAATLKKICSRDAFPYVFVVFLSIYFGAMFNIISQTMAVCVLLWGVTKIIEKRPWQYVLICCGAALFHTATLIAIPLYWIYHKFEKKHRLIVCVCVLAVSVIIAAFPQILRYALSNPLFSKYLGYIDGDRIKTWVYMFVYRAPLYAMESLIALNLVKQDKNCRLYHFLMVLEMASLLLGFGVSWGGRLCYYFSIAHVLLINQAFEQRNMYRAGKVICIGLILYCMIAFFFMHFYSGFDGIMHYRFMYRW